MKTIKELKEAIANLPDDSSLCFWMDSGCCGDFEEMTVRDTDVYEASAKMGYTGSLIFRLETLPGYRSCIQAGGTKRNDEEYWKDKPKVSDSETAKKPTS